MSYQKLYENSKFQVHATNVTGLGLGSYPLVHSRCVREIDGIEYMFRDNSAT